MIYRKWSLLTATPIILGGVVSICLAQAFVFGGNEKFREKLCHEGEMLRQLDRAKMAEQMRG